MPKQNLLKSLAFSQFENHLSHLCIILSPDRALSPAGSRRLKDRRCAGEGAEFSWPSPGVFFFPEFASRLLKVFSRTHTGAQHSFQKLDSETSLLHLLEKSKFDVDPAKLKRDIKEASKLCLIHNNNSEWLELLQETESKNSSPDLTMFSKRVLLFLELQALAQSKGAVLSDWDFLSAASEFLENSDSIDAGAFREIGERNPHHKASESISIHVPVVQMLWPLEERFLNALSKHVPVSLYSSPMNEENFEASPLNALPRTPADSIPKEASKTDWAIAWAYLEDRPKELEALHCIPGNFEIDVASKNTASSNFKLLLLSQYISFKSLGEPDQHPYRNFFRHHSKIQKWVKTLETQTLADVSIHALEEFKGRELSADHKSSLSKLSDSQLVNWLRYCSSESAYNSPIEAPTHPRLSTAGLDLFTPQDLPFSGSKHKLLCMAESEVKEFFLPLSAHNLSKSLFPSSIVKALQHRQIQLPDPAEDARLLAGAFESVAEDLSILSPSCAAAPKPQANPEFRSQRLASYDAFSPSALESWATCSMRFYFEKIHRLSPSKDFNEIPINPMNLGNWVHHALEKLILELDTSPPTFERVLEVLDENKASIFEDQSTPAYLNALEGETALMASQLFAHLSQFEAPLSKLLGKRTLRIEESLSSHINKRSFKGRFDRMDEFASGLKLLWDYKTGNISHKQSTTLIRNNKFQWQLYKKLLDQDSSQIAGGGYINPLMPSKSHLIAYTSEWDAGQLENFRELCNNTGHRLEVIDDKLAATVASDLDAKLQEIFTEIDQGRLEARGKINQDCKYCQFKSLCGKPFLDTGESMEEDGGFA